MLVRLAPVALAAIVLAGCGNDAEETADAPGEEPTPVATGSPVPLGCEHAVPAVTVPTTKGLTTPDGVRVIVGSTRKRPDDERITVVEGYVERVPNQFVKSFDAQKDIKVLFSENEEFEAELLVSDGRYRSFWKVVRTCLAASKFTALYAAERDGNAVAGAAPATKTPMGKK